ncbi:zinc finger protein 892-like [Littorina saxatilis]|uniref:C2H2-type domain-containing protein n=2 Tax=Littorina saxatilis TaxID=31220 RepID=A0AAN9GG04_9CAEN
MATVEDRMHHSRMKTSPASEDDTDSDYKPSPVKPGGRRRSRQRSVKAESKAPPLLLVWEGYMYKNDGVAKGSCRSYWRCQRNNKRGGVVSKCRGRVAVKEGELQVSEQHCHEPDTTDSNYVPPHSLVLEMRNRGMDVDMWTAMKGFVSPTDKLLLHNCNTRLSKKHRCSVCRRDFAVARVYEVHRMLEHEVPPAWRCEECGMQFLHGASYKVHVTQCHGVMPYVCHAEGCDAAFDKKIDLKLHSRRQHPAVNPAASNNTACSTSPAVDMAAMVDGCSVIPVAKEEAGVEEEEKPVFRCHHCPAEFPHACRLRYHMRFHTGERPFKCPNCSMAFFTSSSRLVHIRRSHLRLRRHLCDLCGKKFKDVRSLRQHTWTHTGEKNYSCPVCSRAFSKKNAMVVHMRQHTGEKPHVCDQCGQSFTVRVSLRTHLKSKHDIVVDTSSFRRKEEDPGDNSLPAIGRPKRDESEKQLSVKARAKLEEEGYQHESSQSKNRNSCTSAAPNNGSNPSFSASTAPVGLERKSDEFSLPEGSLVPLSQADLYDARLPAFSSGLTLLQMVGQGHSMPGGHGQVVPQAYLDSASGTYPVPPLSSVGYNGYTMQHRKY